MTSPKRIAELLATGDANRKMSSTNYNEHSSRSHTVFRIVVESKEKTVIGAPYSKATRVSTLSLTDLAGSESLRLSGAIGMQRKEGSYINKSLLTLSMVIRALSKRKKGGACAVGHVPYRNSKLTRILRSSLSGNSRVGIVCCVTPGTENVEETINTLDFANRATAIEMKATVNEIVDDRALLQQYRKEIETLKAQLDALRMSNSVDDLLEAPKLIRRRSSGDFSKEQLDEMLELEDMISRLDHVILSAHSMPPSPPRKTDGAFRFPEKVVSSEKKTSPRMRRRSGSFKGAEMSSIAASAGDDDEVVRRSETTENDEDVASMDMTDLEAIKLKLSSFYRKKKSSSALVRRSTARRLLFQSVQHADSAFLQKMLKERDEVIEQMVTLIDAMEEKCQSLEQSGASLRAENESLRGERARLLNILESREKELAALKGVGIEEETF